MACAYGMKKLWKFKSLNCTSIYAIHSIEFNRIRFMQFIVHAGGGQRMYLIA